jgi:hypothetical protein
LFLLGEESTTRLASTYSEVHNCVYCRKYLVDQGKRGPCLTQVDWIPSINKQAKFLVSLTTCSCQKKRQVSRFI